MKKYGVVSFAFREMINPICFDFECVLGETISIVLPIEGQNNNKINGQLVLKNYESQYDSIEKNFRRSI